MKVIKSIRRNKRVYRHANEGAYLKYQNHIKQINLPFIVNVLEEFRILVNL